MINALYAEKADGLAFIFFFPNTRREPTGAQHNCKGYGLDMFFCEGKVTGQRIGWNSTTNFYQENDNFSVIELML